VTEAWDGKIRPLYLQICRKDGILRWMTAVVEMVRYGCGCDGLDKTRQVLVTSLNSRFVPGEIT
jgi:hypothetical protein